MEPMFAIHDVIMTTDSSDTPRGLGLLHLHVSRLDRSWYTLKMSILTDILRDMYVDPELLEQLSMEQRDVLFRQMREEQIRRWRLKEDELEKKERARPPRRTAPKVEFDLELIYRARDSIITQALGNSFEQSYTK